MSKYRLKIAAIGLSLTLFVGCSSAKLEAGSSYCSISTSGSESVNPAESIQFTDDLNRQVTVGFQPKRTAALIGSFASVWTLAGGELVATTNNAWTEFDLHLSDDVVNLGTSKHASLEKLLAAEPDFVIASTKTQLNLDWMETLEQAGISVAYFDVSTFDDYLHMLKICTEITGRKELYEENGTKIQSQVDKAIARANDSMPTVLYLRGSATSVKVKSSKGSVLGEMLKDMKCSNIADADKSLMEELSLERIMELDPQYIFIVKQGNDEKAVEENLNQTLLTHPAWKELTAVKEGRLYYMDSNLYNLKPNNRWGEAYEKLADILYPA